MDILYNGFCLGPHIRSQYRLGIEGNDIGNDCRRIERLSPGQGFEAVFCCRSSGCSLFSSRFTFHWLVWKRLDTGWMPVFSGKKSHGQVFYIGTRAGYGMGYNFECTHCNTGKMLCKLYFCTSISVFVAFFCHVDGRL